MISDTLKVAALALALVFLSMALQVNIDLNLTDEGYLWYGAVQTVAGQVPVRDFQSYDPGRYYWSALWMLLFGDGIIALRLSAAIFQVIGLTLGLLALRRVNRSWVLLALSGLILLLWMIPRHKVFESSLAMAAVWFALRLIENPTIKQHFVSGLFVGLAAFFGRNHGLYGFLAFALLILLIRFRIKKTSLPRCGLAWAGGVFAGYSPMLVMMLTVPGFFESFIGPFRYILSRGSTNMPLPVPWPWLFDYSKKTLLQGLVLISIGLSFLLLPIYHLSAMAGAIAGGNKKPARTALLAATSFVGLFYMHHAFSRADLAHLGQGIAPLIIGLLALPFLFWGNRFRAANLAVLTGLLAMTIFATFPKNCFLGKITAPPGHWVKVDIAGDDLWLRTGMAQYVKTAKVVNEHLIGEDENVLCIPWSPTMYAILERKSPLREMWFWEQQTEEKQQQFIEQLNRRSVNWIFFEDRALDRREELRFQNTHPLLWKFIEVNFQHVEGGFRGNYKLLHRMKSPS